MVPSLRSSRFTTHGSGLAVVAVVPAEQVSTRAPFRKTWTSLYVRTVPARKPGSRVNTSLIGDEAEPAGASMFTCGAPLRKLYTEVSVGVPDAVALVIVTVPAFELVTDVIGLPG